MFAFSRFLLYFAEVAYQGSLHKASEALHMSASSTDRQILHVEQELAMPLFERHPTELHLAAAGESLLHVTNNWKKDFTRVCEQLDDLRGLRWGHVCIATINATNRHFFSTMLKEAHRHYPNISFTLTAINSICTQQMLISNEADLDIMFNPQTSCGLQVRAFAEMNTDIVVPTGHPLASHSAMRFSQCIDYSFILPPAPLMINESVEALVNISGNEVKEVAVSNDIHMIRTLIKEQMGIGILCRPDILDEIESSQLAFVPLIDPQPKPSTPTLCISPARQLPLAVSMMLDQLGMLFSQL